MNKSVPKYGFQAVAVVAMALSLSARASSPGYLPVVGPPPLRFQGDVHPPSLQLPPLEMQNNTASDVTEFPTHIPVPESVTYSAASRTNDVQQQYFWPFPYWYWPMPDSSNSTPSGGETPQPHIQPTPTNTMYTPHTASDLLVVTPQMLADYFSQSQSATNAASPTARTPVEFTPANPAAPPESSARMLSP